ncbi:MULTISPECIES: 23S rRNA (guanosine(2251)-2'-O)-methyltransferase RlmB [Cryobacterium]|uniref:23S rRNA (guanosine(2251)-2'-O)-methyltransferase RlmB n=1 Tax=Cryobacterium TaxID=69578 RepID=UPI000B4C403D|nr:MULTISPECIES: 23S rRNA (guanosine(2251)-2'-O)-methyltransferase RlmB [Cryobacterium]ASD22999.1 23S rRNA (guanosine(2251)-2'-O)-methyltransferase RlmB [Cryobacterium sp. LW097]POH68643.1 23S rRNA (guanosine(2251)-2'-O)-methyltransferase RlmB [Cryobacterium zongtaii]TFC48523.1 23S rRNA (guanosine(2251)-2'-O)-methyltransferase RlmB [Cryobacterium sp. TMN-39-2]TFC53993.1 23S rRNA (guanosine(2251)-2'-O)-methyltransferase RlmB [Cryobacterium sp. TMB3-1-2]TFC73719.1 23S rRNA (guanosine(2251)-2'-O)
MKNTDRKSRTGAVRKGSRGPQVGSGGQGRQALEGKKPTPKAEDRPYHPAGKAKAAKDRFAAAGGGRSRAPGGSGAPRTGRNTGTGNTGGGGSSTRKAKSDAEFEVVTGRNSVLEALRAKIPASALYVATRIEMDDRVKEVLKLATTRNIPVLEVMRPEIDRLSGKDAVHQGLALKVPAYEYAHPIELLDLTISRGHKPLFVALDGITDPRNLGAIIRSTAAFGGHGVIVPQRRSVGVTASAWKTSAGAAARLPVAMAPNLTQTLKALKERGMLVIGLDGGGDTELPELGLGYAERPIVVVVGSEGKGLSRLVTETCDAIVSIPINANTESLNAGIAAGVTLYEISKLRAEALAAKVAKAAAAAEA